MSETTILCPVCNSSLPAASTECPNCGAVLADQDKDIPAPIASMPGTTSPSKSAAKPTHRAQHERSPLPKDLTEEIISWLGTDPSEKSTKKKKLIQSLRENNLCLPTSEPEVVVKTEVVERQVLVEVPVTVEKPVVKQPIWAWMIAVVFMALAVIFFINSSRKSEALEVATSRNQQLQRTLSAQSGELDTAYTQIDLQSTQLAEAQSGPMSDENLVFGPISGMLYHNNNNNIESQWAGVSLNNFVIRTIFINPYDNKPWDYGFRFRSINGQGYRLTFFSNQTWKLTYHLSDIPINEGFLENLLLGESQRNDIYLFVDNDHIKISVNGSEVASFIIPSDHLEAGDIGISTGIWSGDKSPGETTYFENLTIWRFP